MREIADLVARIAELERRASAGHLSGTVHAVDPAKGLVRLNLGDATGGGPALSPWVRYAQTGGALKVHAPPTVGQQMTVMAPAGDMSQGIAMSLGWSDANPSPSGAGDQNVLTFGAVTVTMTGSALTIEVGGSSIEITAGGIQMTAPRIDLN